MFEVELVKKNEYVVAVDGRNPAPVDMEHLPLLAGFYTCQVVQDFFHQQYGQHLLCIGCNYRPYKTGVSPTQYFVSWTEFQHVLNVYF